MTNLEYIESKICSLNSLQEKIEKWHSENKKVVFTNGCFDILHLGHVTYLAKACELGDILVVGINSDSSPYWSNKGPNRPINNEKSRALIVSTLFFVDAVILFSEETPLELIKVIKPDILVKGKDYKEENIVGYDIVKSNGGKIMTIDLVNGYSTTNIIDKINHNF